MREIKFSAWHKNNNRMCEDVKTNLLDRDYLEFMQYTGIQDINKKEIYEGDIVQTNTRFGRGVVTYKSGLFTCNEVSLCTFRGAEVIGNFFEDKNLLSKELKSKSWEDISY